MTTTRRRYFFFVPSTGPVFRMMADGERVEWRMSMDLHDACGIPVGLNTVTYDRTELEAWTTDDYPANRIYFYRERGLEPRFALAKLLDPEHHDE